MACFEIWPKKSTAGSFNENMRVAKVTLKKLYKRPQFPNWFCNILTLKIQLQGFVMTTTTNLNVGDFNTNTQIFPCLKP